MHSPRPPGADAHTRPAFILGHKYRIERVIGEGAFGRVYLATDTRLRRPVAIKELLATRNATMPDDFRRYAERFEREARAGGAIIHPNVVTVHEMNLDADGNTYLVMEYVDGTNLRDLLAQAHSLPPRRAVALALDLARGLEAIHDADIVHRDLKPANIMISRRGTAKVGDFGVAQIGSESQRTQTNVGHPGTPMYLSPEQASGFGYLDGRSDLYSLGLILYEMLVGEAYVRRRVPIRQIKPDIAPALAATVEQLLESDRHARTPDAATAIAQLAVLVGSPGPDARVAPPPDTLPVTQTQPPPPMARFTSPGAATPPARVRGVRAKGAVAAIVGVVLLTVVGGGIAALAGRGGGGAITPVPNATVIGMVNGASFPTPTTLVATLGVVTAAPPKVPPSPMPPPATAASTTTLPITAAVPGATPSTPPTIAPARVPPATAAPIPTATVPPPRTPPPGSVKLTPGAPLPTDLLPLVFVHPQGLYTFHYPQDAMAIPPNRLNDVSFMLDSDMLISVSSATTPFRQSDQELANNLLLGPNRTVTEANTVKIAGYDSVRGQYTTRSERGVLYRYYVAAFSTDTTVVYLLASVADGNESLFDRRLPTLDAIAGSFTGGAKLTQRYTDPGGRFSYQYPDPWRETTPTYETQRGRIAVANGAATFHVSIADDLGSFSTRDFYDRNLTVLSNPDYGLKNFRRVSESDTTINGQAMKVLVITGESDGVPLEVHQWLFVKDGRGYTLTFRVALDRAREFADIGDVVANTFVLR